MKNQEAKNLFIDPKLKYTWKKKGTLGPGPHTPGYCTELKMKTKNQHCQQQQRQQHTLKSQDTEAKRV